MSRLVLGLGSSDRDGLVYLRRAMASLKALPGFKILQVSPLYRSDAMLPESAPESWDLEYMNLAVLAEVGEGTPEEWLMRFQSVESRLGRIHRERWAPRVMDVDILAWEDRILSTDRLTVPHPGLLDRPFALLPLADVAPDWVHPLKGRTARELSGKWRDPRASASVPYRTKRFPGSLTEIVGILNVTPDSFSDGGRFQHSDGFLEQARRLILEGATVLDLGAESTRPGAVPILPAEELDRLSCVAPALLRLRSEHPEIALSLDTRHPSTVFGAASLVGENGWDWINDVSGLRSDEMVQKVVESGADAVFMHSMSVPPRADEVISPGEDPITYLLEWARDRSDHLARQGIPKEKQIFDPGVGFGKTLEQNLEILKRAGRFHELGLRVLVGHSRKSFIAGIAQVPAPERDLETVLVSIELQRQGIEFIRVHRADWHMRAFRWISAW